MCALCASCRNSEKPLCTCVNFKILERKPVVHPGFEVNSSSIILVFSQYYSDLRLNTAERCATSAGIKAFGIVGLTGPAS